MKVDPQIYSLLEILAQENDEVKVSTAIAIIGRKGEDISTEEVDSFCDIRRFFGVQPDERQLSHIIDIQDTERKNNLSQDKKVLRLWVDNIIGIKPLMVMPAGELLAKAKAFSGVGIMENGDISIILDTESLIRSSGY